MALRRDPTRKTSDYTSSSTGGLADRSGSGLEVDVALLGPGDVLDLVSYNEAGGDSCGVYTGEVVAQSAMVVAYSIPLKVDTTLCR